MNFEATIIIEDGRNITLIPIEKISSIHLDNNTYTYPAIVFDVAGSTFDSNPKIICDDYCDAKRRFFAYNAMITRYYESKSLSGNRE